MQVQVHLPLTNTLNYTQNNEPCPNLNKCKSESKSSGALHLYCTVGPTVHANCGEEMPNFLDWRKYIVSNPEIHWVILFHLAKLINIS